MAATDADLLDRFVGASDAHVIAALLGWRAQLRGGVSPKLRTRLERNVPVLAREAKRRGLKMPKSKALYPAAGSTTTARVGPHGAISVESFGTPRAPRPPKPPPKPVSTPPVDLLQALEASVEQAMKKTNDKT